MDEIKFEARFSVNQQKIYDTKTTNALSQMFYCPNKHFETKIGNFIQFYCLIKNAFTLYWAPF